MEILDLEELKENKSEVIDENLKGFMSKDEEVSKLLEDKIGEIDSETEKLNAKEEEIRDLEESSREKISMDASPDELIEIAGKIKSAQSELSEINANIEKLENEKKELEETKNNIEETKKEYIKNLSDANSDYQNQISKIEDAIAVCDNPSLKQVLEDVKKEKERKLASLQESRNNELKTALNPAIESVEPKEEKVDNIDPITNTEMNVSDESIINEPETNNLEIPKIEPEIDIPVVNEENAIQNTEDQVKEDSMIGLDSILSSNDEIVMPKLTNVETDKIEMPKVEEKRVKVIFSKDVPDVAVKEILSSSTVMPNVYSYLGNNIISNGGILL